MAMVCFHVKYLQMQYDCKITVEAVTQNLNQQILKMCKYLFHVLIVLGLKGYCLSNSNFLQSDQDVGC